MTLDHCLDELRLNLQLEMVEVYSAYALASQGGAPNGAILCWRIALFVRESAQRWYHPPTNGNRPKPALSF